MVVLRSAVVLFALLCFLAISDGQRQKRQLSTLPQLEALSKKLHLNITGISWMCKVSFYASNSKCLNAMAGCVSATDPHSAEQCFHLAKSCGTQCNARDRCSVKVQPVLPIYVLTPIPMCFPQVCRSNVGAFNQLLVTFTKAVFTEGTRIGKYIAPNFVQNAVTSCGSSRGVCKSASKCYAIQVRGGGGASTPHSHGPHPNGTAHAWSPSHSGHPLSCNGRQCPAGTSCCKVNGREIGCCQPYAHAVFDSIVTKPLRSMTSQCGNSFIQDKAVCLQQYLSCLNSITTKVDSIFKGGLPDISKLGNIPSACIKLTPCFTAKPGVNPCTSSSRCTIGLNATSGLVPGGGKQGGNVSLCVPTACSTKSDLQHMSSMIYSFVCGPACIFRRAFAKSGLSKYLPKVDCPFQRSDMTCYNPTTHRRDTLKAGENYKVCAIAQSMFKNDPKYTHQRPVPVSPRKPGRPAAHKPHGITLPPVNTPRRAVFPTNPAFPGHRHLTFPPGHASGRPATPGQWPAKPGQWPAKPGHGGKSNPHERYPYCAGMKCPDRSTCCKINGRQIGCCVHFVQALLDSIVTKPLKSTSGQCGKALVREKSACLSEYVSCLNDVATAASSIATKDGKPDLSKVDTVPQACKNLANCFATSSGNQPCTLINKCTVATTQTRGFFNGLIPVPHGSQSLCLPSECKSKNDLQLVSSLVYSFLCGPLCVIRKALAKAGLKNMLPRADCPIDHITVTCFNPAAHRQMTVRESDDAKVCAAADNLFNSQSKTTQKAGSKDSGDGWKDLYNSPSHSKSDDKKKKQSFHENMWFKIAIGIGAVALVAGIIVVIRWRITVARRRQMNAFNYTGLGSNPDEMTASVDNH